MKMEALEALEALDYLDDIAHGRKMNVDPYELKLIVEKDLEALELIKAFLKGRICFDGRAIIFSYSDFHLRVSLMKKYYKLLKEVLDDEVHR